MGGNWLWWTKRLETWSKAYFNHCKAEKDRDWLNLSTYYWCSRPSGAATATTDQMSDQVHKHRMFLKKKRPNLHELTREPKHRSTTKPQQVGVLGSHRKVNSDRLQQNLGVLSTAGGSHGQTKSGNESLMIWFQSHTERLHPDGGFKPKTFLLWGNRANHYTTRTQTITVIKDNNPTADRMNTGVCLLRLSQGVSKGVHCVFT